MRIGQLTATTLALAIAFLVGTLTCRSDETFLQIGRGPQACYAGGSFDSQWRVYASRLAHVFRVDSSRWAVQWYSLVTPEGDTCRIEPHERGVSNTKSFRNGELAPMPCAGSFQIQAANETSIGELRLTSGGRLAVTMNSTLSAQLVADEWRGDPRLGDEMSSRSRRGVWLRSGQKQEEVQEVLKPVIIKDSRIIFATYAERTAKCRFTPDGSILMSNRAPFFETIPFTSELFDPEIGEPSRRVTLLNRDLSVQWSVHGGPGWPDAEVAFDSVGNIIIAGATALELPKTSGTLQPDNPGGTNGFISKWTPDGRCLWYTYIGGSAEERLTAIACDGSGRIYVLGTTSSNDFPTKNAFMPSKPNGAKRYAAFLTCVSPDGDQIIWSTYIGSSDPYGPDGDGVRSFGTFSSELMVNQHGVFATFSQAWPDQLPVSPDAYSTEHKSGLDGWLGCFDHEGRLEWSTLVNTHGDDEITHMFAVQGGDILLYVRSQPSSNLTRFDVLPAIGVPGQDSTLERHAGFVYRFSPDGRVKLVWSHSVAPMNLLASDLHIDSTGFCTFVGGSQLGTTRVNPILYEPNAYRIDPSLTVLSQAVTDDYYQFDTVFATPLMGSGPSQVDVYQGEILTASTSMPSSGACLTDTTWTSGEETFDGVLSYMTLLTGKSTIVSDHAKRVPSQAKGKLIQSIGPNPATYQLHVKPTDAFLPARFEIVDVIGRLMKSGSITTSGEFAIAVQDLPSGVYFLVVRNDHQHETTPVVIQ